MIPCKSLPRSLHLGPAASSSNAHIRLVRRALQSNAPVSSVNALDTTRATAASSRLSKRRNHLGWTSKFDAHERIPKRVLARFAHTRNTAGSAQSPANNVIEEVTGLEFLTEGDEDDFDLPSGDDAREQQSKLRTPQVALRWIAPNRPVWLNFHSAEIAQEVETLFKNGHYRILGHNVNGVTGTVRNNAGTGHPPSWSLLVRAPASAARKDVEAAITSLDHKPHSTHVGDITYTASNDEVYAVVRSRLEEIGPLLRLNGPYEQGIWTKAFATFTNELDTNAAAELLNYAQLPPLGTGRIHAHVQHAGTIAKPISLYNALKPQVDAEVNRWKDLRKVSINTSTTRTSPFYQYPVATFHIVGEESDVKDAKAALKKVFQSPVLKLNGSPLWSPVFIESEKARETLKEFGKDLDVLVVAVPEFRWLQYYGPQFKMGLVISRIKQSLTDAKPEWELTTHASNSISDQPTQRKEQDSEMARRQTKDVPKDVPEVVTGDKDQLQIISGSADRRSTQDSASDPYSEPMSEEIFAENPGRENDNIHVSGSITLKDNNPGHSSYKDDVVRRIDAFSSDVIRKTGSGLNRRMGSGVVRRIDASRGGVSRKTGNDVVSRPGSISKAETSEETPRRIILKGAPLRDKKTLTFGIRSTGKPKEKPGGVLEGRLRRGTTHG